TITTTNPAGSPSTFNSPAPVAADGSVTVDTNLTFQGSRTISVAAAGVTLSTTVTVLPATFTVTATQSRNGFISVQTKVGIVCSMYATAPDGTVGPSFVRN